MFNNSYNFTTRWHIANTLAATVKHNRNVQRLKQRRSQTILRPGANYEIGTPYCFIFSHNPNTSIEIL